MGSSSDAVLELGSHVSLGCMGWSFKANSPGAADLAWWGKEELKGKWFNHQGKTHKERLHLSILESIWQDANCLSYQAFVLFCNFIRKENFNKVRPGIVHSPSGYKNYFLYLVNKKNMVIVSNSSTQPASCAPLRYFGSKLRPQSLKGHPPKVSHYLTMCGRWNQPTHLENIL